jgi:hypothetical protein
MSRTFKKPYQKSRRFDKTCRCHGGCPWCLGNRMHGHAKRILKVRQQMFENELRGFTRGSKKGA